MSDGKKLNSEYVAELFELQSHVNANRAQAYAARSRVTENAIEGLKMVLAAFSENRQVLNEVTENIYRIRKGLIRCQQNLSSDEQEVLIDKAELDYLDHRASLTGHVLDINSSMSKVNQTVIGLLGTISKTNSKVYEYNTLQHKINLDMVQNGIAGGKFKGVATKNAKTTVKLTDRAQKNSEHLEEIFEKTEINSHSLTESIEHLKEELALIDSQWESIESMQHLCFEMLSDL
tara:strand:- start:1250 stop:1948 length:699 start_codon:yes stop_codon:yes gene_type:complete